jgi:hypothetical protein
MKTAIHHVMMHRVVNEHGQWVQDEIAKNPTLYGMFMEDGSFLK